MNLVIDANVAIKWFVAENLHAEAGRLLEGGDDLHAPDFLVVELANVAWKKAKRQEITRQQAEQISAACLDGVPVLHASSSLVERATRIALDLGHPVYDCIYIACAEAVEGVLITADEKLEKIVENTKFKRLIRSLNASLEKLVISHEKLKNLIKLAEIMAATQNNVSDMIGTGEEIKFIDTKDMAPFFNSPSLRSVRKFIEELRDDERADVLALMWLGQGHSGNDWRTIRERAGEMVGSFANQHFIYLVSLTVYLERGFKKFQEILNPSAGGSP